MVRQGVVKNGRVELEPGTTLPEGTVVRVETVEKDWLVEWAEFARKVAEASKDSRPALEILAETRR